jgi:hypothetical protein
MTVTKANKTEEGKCPSLIEEKSRLKHRRPTFILAVSANKVNVNV